MSSPSPASSPSPSPESPPPKLAWGDKRNAMIMVATLLATSAFQLGVSPPGGLWQENSPEENGYKAGTAVIATNCPQRFNYFRYLNLTVFAASVIRVGILLADVDLESHPIIPGTPSTLIFSMLNMLFNHIIVNSCLGIEVPGTDATTYIALFATVVGVAGLITSVRVFIKSGMAGQIWASLRQYLTQEESSSSV